jgi:hypothetical protein
MQYNSDVLVFKVYVNINSKHGTFVTANKHAIIVLHYEYVYIVNSATYTQLYTTI